MSWLIVTAVGFVLAAALVIWLARTSTARWERERRAARSPRSGAVPVPRPPVGAAARPRRVLVRTAAASPRVSGSPPGRLRQLIGVLRTPRRLLSQASPLRQARAPDEPALVGGRTRRWKRTTTGVPDQAVGDEKSGKGDREPQPPGSHRSAGSEARPSALDQSRAGTALGARSQDHPRQD